MAPALDLHKDFELDEDSLSDTPTKSGRISAFLTRITSSAKPPKPGANKYSSRRVFRILNKTLQPESSVTAEDAAAVLATLLPPVSGPDGSDELSSIMEVFLEIAWQIPYNHPSMIKLVRIMLCLLETNRSLRISTDQTPFHQNEGYEALQSVVRDYAGQPYDADAAFTSKHVGAWVSQHAFLALLASFGKVELCLFGLWVMRDAFEESTTPQSADADAAAAAQWILHAGQALFRFVQVPKLISPGVDVFEVTDHGLLYSGAKGDDDGRSSSSSSSLRRWQFWKAGFARLAASPKSDPEARQLAASAAALMGVFEANAPLLT